ncbi:MAG: S46 family peptidase [Bacteroidota bacterium]
MKKIFSTILLFTIFFNTNLFADEGMWLPMLIKRLNYVDMQKMGLQLTPDEIYSINNSSLKDAIVGLADKSTPTDFFCTAEVISNEGLLLTNHHCAFDALQTQSSVSQDYLSNGFWAMKKAEELPIEDMAAVFLVRMEDVTERVLKNFTPDMTEAQRLSKEQEIINVITREASESNHFTASVTSFFEGNEYYLFVYDVKEDVRLVGAPPSSIGRFGGDTDNWMWPRHTGDFSLLRVYNDAKNKSTGYSKTNVPFTPKHSLPISISGYKENDISIVMGFPGSTERFLSSFGVKLAIEQTNPSIVKIRNRKLDVMSIAMNSNPATKIQYASKYASTSNYYKYFIGSTKQLKRQNVFAEREALEKKFASWINLNDDRKQIYGNVISDISDAYSIISKYNKLSTYIEEAGFQGPEVLFFSFGLSPVSSDFHSVLSTTPDNKEKLNQISANFLKDSEKFFKDYDVNVDKKLFVELMGLFVSDIPKEQLPDIFNTIEKKYKGSIQKFANELYAKSIFADKARLTNFFAKPSIKVLEKDLGYQIMTSFIGKYFDINSEINAAQNSLNKAQRLFVKGLMQMNADKNFYADANSTMRLTYGKVEDCYPSDAVRYDYFTTMDGLMAKEDTANEEFIVPSKLKQLYKNKDYGRYGKDGVMNVCFISSNDITGGNSGSPVINGKGELIGIAFDGNWEAMSGDISYSERYQRCISVDIRYVLFIIDKFAGAQNIIDELKIN